MKKSYFLLGISFIVGGMLLISCKEDKKLTPEEEVRNYGKYFVEKLSANQLDSLKASFPDIIKGDSIVPVQSDTIMIVESTPGNFDMTLAEGITLKVNRSEDGNITVTESKGLFAFPTDKVDLAKKTGMWDDTLSDVLLNERMKDEEFFKYIQNQIKKKTSNILSVKGDAGIDTMYQYIVNNTDQPISGSDYVILKEENMRYEKDDIPYNWAWDTRKYTVPGRNIPPHGQIKEEAWVAAMGNSDLVTGVRMKLTPEQLQEKFARFSGNEYQEYLDSKK